MTDQLNPRAPGAPYAWPSAIITGGGTGLGRALSVALAADGIDAFIWGRKLERLEETAALAAECPGRVVPVSCDVSDEEQVMQALATSTRDGEPPGMLVNNAAGAYVALAEEISPQGWHKVLAASLHGVFLVSTAWCRARVEHGGGVMLNVTSATTDNGSPGTVHSGAAKAGVTSLTKSLAVEWARWGIRVNAIAPGAFSTAGGAEQIWSDEEIEKRILGAIPLGRFAHVQEIVEPARFLLTEAASYFTGATIKVDGGWTLNDWLYLRPDNTKD